MSDGGGLFFLFKMLQNHRGNFRTVFYTYFTPNRRKPGLDPFLYHNFNFHPNTLTLTIMPPKRIERKVSAKNPQKQPKRCNGCRVAWANYYDAWNMFLRETQQVKAVMDQFEAKMQNAQEIQTLRDQVNGLMLWVTRKGQFCFCEEIVKKTDAAVTSCGHIFHKKCLEQWLNQQESTGQPKTCPDCRNAIQDLPL